MLATEAPFPQFFDTNGSPLSRGSLYFGVVNLNPETNPITVYWDSAGTQPAAQPILTLNGYATRNGSPAIVYANVDYSLNVRNGRGNLVYYAPSSVASSNAFALQASGGSALVGFIAAGGIARTVQAELREAVKITQFGAVGQNRVLDTAALVAAIASLGSAGGRIRMPALASGAYIFDASTIADLGSGTNPIELFGDGWATGVQVGSACTNFFTMSGAWSALSDFRIIDPNNFCTASFILSKPSSGSPSLERRVERIHGIGPGNASTATLLVNDGGQQLRSKGCSAQNMLGAFWNKGGGVDSTIEGLYGLGIKYGVRLDLSATYGHAENLTVRDSTMLCTQANSIAFWLTDSLHCKFENVVGAQLGSGGIGVYMDGVTGLGSNLTTFIDCYFEGSDTAPAIKSRGANQRFHMIGGGMGQGGYAANLINCIDFDGANGFIFDNVEAFFPSGNCNKVATIANSSGVVTATCKNWGAANVASTETASAVRWELEASQGSPSVRLSTSQYPQADWTAFTPVVTSGTGTITTLGAVDCAYRVDGKTVHYRGSITITTNGTAATSIFITLPLSGKAGKKFMFVGREDGVSGSILQGALQNAGMTITTYNNGYPGANGAIILFNGTYEAA